MRSKNAVALGGVTLLLSGCIALGGIIWAWQYDRAKSLLGPWLSHLVVDAFLMIVGQGRDTEINLAKLPGAPRLLLMPVMAF